MSTPPAFYEPTRILARTAEAPAMLMGDQLFQRLLRHRIILLGQQVDEDIANRICAELVLLAAEDAKADISIYINSPGGSVYAGLAIYDVMQYVPNDIATYAMGMAASMGQFLLCAGTEGKRFALPHAQILMHQPSGGIGGSGSRPSRCCTSSARWPSAPRSTPGRPSSRSRPTRTATGGSPLRKPRSTASWTA